MRNVPHRRVNRQVPTAQSALDIARDEQRADEVQEARAILASEKGEQRAMAAQSPASPFNFGDHPVRVVVKDGDPWFVAQDAMASLEYAANSKPAKVMAHIPEEWKGVNPIHTPGGEQQMLCLSEPGLYFFLGRSDKPKALPFQKWLAADVVPQIRKTGAYVPKAYAANPGDVLTKEQQDVLRQLVKSTAERLPKEKQGAASIKMWSKLKAHFGVAYREIPQQEFSEAVSLLTRASTEWELVDEEPEATPIPSDRQALAFAAASQVAAIASRTVFESVLAGDHSWNLDRWVFGLKMGNPKIGEKEQEPYCVKVERDAIVASVKKMAALINTPNGIMPSNTELAELAEACNRKLSSRLAYAASKAS